MSLLSACADQAQNESERASPPDAGTASEAGVVAEVDVRSRAPALKKKDGEQLSRDLAAALELERFEVCTELGRYDCAQEAHRIVLGGVEPYQLRIDRPLPGVGVGAPIAVDRMALSACSARARADFSSTAPVVFGPLASGDPSGRDRAVDALYERFLFRPADPGEKAALLSEWSQTTVSDQDFATLSCFVVATSLEHLFY